MTPKQLRDAANHPWEEYDERPWGDSPEEGRRVLDAFGQAGENYARSLDELALSVLCGAEYHGARAFCSDACFEAKRHIPR